MREDFLKLKQELELLIRKGQFSDIQTKLQSLPAKQIPRQHVSDMAALARRAHLWKLSLKWLHPIIRSTVQRDKKPSSKEVLEYALALQKAGSLNEAEELLKGLNSNEEPRVLLARAYLAMASWDYGKAELFLADYVKSKSLSDYERSIGKVNHAAALVSINSPLALPVLKDLEIELKTAGHNLLLSNCYEISAQNAVINKNWAAAEAALKNAGQLVQKEKNLDSLFIEKWQVIAEALKNQDAKKLNEFRPKAMQLGHWETLRDLDFYQAMLRPESQWSNWVYYGTPHLPFRRRLETFRSFPEQQWVSRGEHVSQKIDPWFLPSDKADISHRCFVLLLRDFYRPLRVGEVFGNLFPHQFFDPVSSPNRVHQTMTRFRKWLSEFDTSFTLLEMDGNYALRCQESTALLCRKRILNCEESSFLFSRYDFWKDGDFSSQEISDFMSIPITNLQRKLKKAVDDGVLIKVGSGRVTTYRLNKI